MRRTWTVVLVVGRGGRGWSSCGTSGPATGGPADRGGGVLPARGDHPRARRSAVSRSATSRRPGVEPHDLELTTDDMDAILDARLVVLMGKGFQPAIESGADRRDRARRCGSSTGCDVGDDPHVWLDPVLDAPRRRA